MNRRRTITIVAAALAATVAAPVSPATAHDRAWRTTASWGLTESGGEAVVGYIRSANQECLNDRKVKAYLVRAGRDRLVGVDRRSGYPVGSGDGYVSAPVNLQDGKRYYIKVVAKNLGSGSHDHLCKAYTTRPVRWVDPTSARPPR